MGKYFNRSCGTDVTPYELVKAITEKTVEVRAMDTNVVKVPDAHIGGFCAHFENHQQEWEITSNSNNEVIRLRKHKDGRWYHHGSRFAESDKPFKYYDYNF